MRDICKRSAVNERGRTFERLNEIGCMMNDRAPGQTILVEFRLPNVPSAMLPMLELIDSFHFNITYIKNF